MSERKWCEHMFEGWIDNCKDCRIAELEAKLRAVGALPDRWMSSKPTHDFGNGVTISYGGKSVDECADELRAILAKYVSQS